MRAWNKERFKRREQIRFTDWQRKACQRNRLSIKQSMNIMSCTV